QSRHQAQCGRLTTAGRPKQGKNFTTLNGKIHTIHRIDHSEAFDDGAKFENRRSHNNRSKRYSWTCYSLSDDLNELNVLNDWNALETIPHQAACSSSASW